MDTKIIELAHLRNKLASNSFGQEDEKMLREVEHKISASDSPFRDIALSAIANCKENIKNNEIKIAVQEIQLIHNFTFYDSSKWDENYFYTIELLSYLEEVDNVSRVKKLISLLAKLESTGKF